MFIETFKGDISRSPNLLDEEVNAFTAQDHVEPIEIQTNSSAFDGSVYYVVTVIYNEKK
ncbi:hypothetical protein [Staphylococcus massiliensis]|uniref:hypothetical protein n=1 Tax=Staphylococcus massiliensis TaxID=555791 RepID=UPI001EDF9D04|nr:hypothetical protein [Staphylococcus massiliensis]MCG3399163.1 hypothetical protein [Staphylococcus massiliensis]MCG3402216.1 hypothetical protein [Staphylococcus massiliensis]MCG3412817.1 hypothetical protein [Staphylococcus massiliensis]